MLLVGDEVVDDPDLVVPHPRMTERAFVLAPLADLDPALGGVDRPTGRTCGRARVELRLPELVRHPEHGAGTEEVDAVARVTDAAGARPRGARTRRHRSLALAMAARGWTPVARRRPRARRAVGAPAAAARLGAPAASSPAAAADADLVVIATPDAAIAAVAAALAPRLRPDALVVHLLRRVHAAARRARLRVPTRGRRAAPAADAARRPSSALARLAGSWCAVAGDPRGRGARDAARDAARSEVADADRVAYHAAACIASNHLVALLGQVERRRRRGVPLDAFLPLVRATARERRGPRAAAALTGPVARGDVDDGAPPPRRAARPPSSAAYRALGPTRRGCSAGTTRELRRGAAVK